MISLKCSKFNSYAKLFSNTQKSLTSIDIFVKLYNGFLDSIIDEVCNFFGVDCKIHGYYDRTIIYKGEKATLRILRILYKSTGRTHAVLPDFIVPYIQATSPEVIRVLLDEVILENSCIIHKDIKKKWNRYWKEKILVLSRNLNKILTDYNKLNAMCVQAYKLSFFQIHRGLYFML